MRAKRAALASLVLASALVGCTLPVRPPALPLAPIEQLLVSRALARSAAQMSLELPPGTSVTLDASGLTSDQQFARDVVAGWLGRDGLRVVDDGDDAEYRVRLIVESLGVEQGVRFLGLPASESIWLPLPIPELMLFKRNREKGYARLYMDVFEAQGWRHVSSTPAYESAVHYTRYTVLFVIDWRTSDLERPPVAIDPAEPEPL